jgi:D-alanyl-D-alanine carboxypeptidase
VEALADRAVAAGIPAVSVAMVRDQQVVTITRGVVSREQGGEISAEHRFRVASIAKSFVASIVLQLVDEHRIALGDTLGQWLPGLVPASTDVTIEQLLRQETGIFDFASDPRWVEPLMRGELDHPWQPSELLALAADHPPDFEPGERWAYSNSNYLVLAMIVEKICGDRLENIVAERITKPLGLKETSMETDSDMAEPYVHGYLVGQGDPIDLTRLSGSAVFGHGNLVSTPLEMTRFYRALVEGKIVSPRQLPLMLSLDPEVPSKYLMGLFRMDDFYPCGTFVGHDGQTPGYDNIAYTSLDGRRQFAMSVSSSTVEDKAGDEQAQEAYYDLAMAIACR